MELRPKPPTGEPRQTTPRAPAPRPPAASSRSQPRHGWSRDRFCEYLRAQRDRASLSIEDIARVTRIPERSIRQLEEGRFEELPADVFVRGFLRSYARVIGVSADDVVRRYAMCGLDPAPVASELAQVAAEQIAALAEADPTVGEVAVARVEAIADEPSGPAVIASGVDEVRTASAPVRSHGKRRRRKSGRHRSRHAGGAPAKAAAREPAPAVEPPVAAATEVVALAPARERAFLPPAWSTEEGGRRGPLTLAVIILVVVATLTMSYLLRLPTYSGDGVTRVDPAGETAPRG
jgi:hypothetical protein